jgi:succinate-acetate transporter protein
MSAISTQARYVGPSARDGDIAARIVESAKWGNSAPLALAAFAVTTFVLSMVNANWVAPTVAPVVFGVALMFGGITQLIAGIIRLRSGNTFTGMLFSSFGVFWSPCLRSSSSSSRMCLCSSEVMRSHCSCTRSRCSLS